jgi:hypothetical protein
VTAQQVNADNAPTAEAVIIQARAITEQLHSMASVLDALTEELMQARENGGPDDG